MEKKLRRICAAFLTLLLCLALVGCGTQSADSEKNSGEVANLDVSTENTTIDATSEIVSNEGNDDSVFDETEEDAHVEPPEQYPFYDFQKFAELRSAQKEGDEAVRKLSLFGIETVDEVEEFFQEIGNKPIPVLASEYTELYKITYYPSGRILELFYDDAKTGGYIIMYAEFGQSLDKYLNDTYADAEVRDVKDCGGYSVTFYKNPQERVKNDIWWTKGLFEVEDTVIGIGFSCAIAKKTDTITLDELTAPLEHLTITTILEQIGEGT